MVFKAIIKHKKSQGNNCNNEANDTTSILLFIPCNASIVSSIFTKTCSKISEIKHSTYFKYGNLQTLYSIK